MRSSPPDHRETNRQHSNRQHHRPVPHRCDIGRGLRQGRQDHGRRCGRRDWRACRRLAAHWRDMQRHGKYVGPLSIIVRVALVATRVRILQAGEASYPRARHLCHSFDHCRHDRRGSTLCARGWCAIPLAPLPDAPLHGMCSTTVSGLHTARRRLAAQTRPARPIANVMRDPTSTAR